MKQSNIIDIRRYSRTGHCYEGRQVFRPSDPKPTVSEICRGVIAVLEALVTAAIGVCCMACLILVYTML